MTDAGTSDPLEPWEREAAGKGARIHFPLRDKSDLLRMSVILRELGNRLEVIAKSRDNEFTALIRTRVEVKAAQARVSSHPKSRQRQASETGSRGG